MFLFPLGLISLIAIPLILLLYILKQKRTKHTVPSLILWRQVLMDMQSRTPWQKLRKNLLMFLQIAAALFIILALSGLAIKMGDVAKESIILVIDSSLSMSSTDMRPTRLEAAKSDAIKYVDELSKNSRVTVVSLSKSADVLLYASDSKSEIKSTIQAVEPTFSHMDVENAVELILSLKKQDNQAVVVLFGDKPINIGSEEIQFSNYKRQNDNLAVIRFTHTSVGEQISAMSTIRNQSDKDSTISISLYGDDAFLDSQLVSVNAEQTKTIWWRNIPDEVQKLSCVIDTEDILEHDNRAYDTVYADKPAKVLLITKGNIFLEKVLSLINNVELTRTLPEELTEYKGYGLYVFDGVMPENMPTDGNLVLFAPPQNNLFEVGGWMDTPEIKKSEHKIFRYISKINFAVGRTRILEKPDWADTVMEYNGNPVIMDGYINNIRMLIFGFNLYETDLPLQSEFPVLMSNIITEYAPGSGNRISGMFVGDIAEFSLHPDTESAEIILPDNSRLMIAPPIPPEPFIETYNPGIYRLEQKKASGTVSTPFAVNLTDEWLIENRQVNSAADANETGTYVPIKKTGYSLKIPLLIAAIIVLLIEWWFYRSKKRSYA